MNKWIKFLFLVTLSFSAISCSKKKELHDLQEFLKNKRYPIAIQTVETRDVPYYVMAVGQLQASVEVDLRAQVSGILTNVLFRDGQKVEEGDLLMVIDPRQYQANLKTAQATLEEDIARLKYSVQFAAAYGAVVGKEYVSRLDYDQGVQNVDVYKAAITSDEAQIDVARLNLEFTEIRSPTQGYIGLRQFDPGNYINSNQNQVLASILKVTPLFLNFSVPSEYVARIRDAQMFAPLYVEGILADSSQPPLKGQLTFINNTVDNETGMIQLQATIPNEDERGWPGEFVRTQLLVDTIRDAVVISSSAIVLTQDGYAVFVVQDDMTVQPRAIQKGIEYENMTVITAGLSIGEKVVTDGQLNLYPGAKVFVPTDTGPTPTQEPTPKEKHPGKSSSKQEGHA